MSRRGGPDVILFPLSERIQQLRTAAEVDVKLKGQIGTALVESFDQHYGTAAV